MKKICNDEELAVCEEPHDKHEIRCWACKECNPKAVDDDYIFCKEVKNVIP